MALDFPSAPADEEVYDRYKWSATDSVWNLNLPEYVPVYDFEYLVIAGGGGGGSYNAGGGGAGGYRSNVSGESSGGGASAESLFRAISADSYTITVGAGGAGGAATLVAIKVLPQLLVLSCVLAVALAVVKTVARIQLWVVPVVGVRHPMLVLRVLLGRVTLVETLGPVAVAVAVVELAVLVVTGLAVLEMTAVPVLLQRLQVLVLLALVVVALLAFSLVLVVPVAVAMVAVAGRLVRLER